MQKQQKQLRHTKTHEHKHSLITTKHNNNLTQTKAINKYKLTKT